MTQRKLQLVKKVNMASAVKVYPKRRKYSAEELVDYIYGEQ